MQSFLCIRGFRKISLQGDAGRVSPVFAGKATHHGGTESTEKTRLGEAGSTATETRDFNISVSL